MSLNFESILQNTELDLKSNYICIDVVKSGPVVMKLGTKTRVYIFSEMGDTLHTIVLYGQAPYTIESTSSAYINHS